MLKTKLWIAMIIENCTRPPNGNKLHRWCLLLLNRPGGEEQFILLTTVTVTNDCATTNNPMIAGTLQRMPCAACVQHSQKRTVGITCSSHITHTWLALAVDTECYARETLAVSLIATKSIA